MKKMAKYFSAFRYLRKFFDLIKGDRNGVSVKHLIPKGDQPLTSSLDALKLFFPNEEAVESEWEKSHKLFTKLENQIDQNFSTDWNSGRNLCAFLYVYIRITKPKLIVETGVANGFTTITILEALRGTEGVLHSFDIDANSKKVGENYKNWYWHQIDFRRPLKSLKNSIVSIEGIDLWLHDSDHSYYWQSNEFTIARKKIKKHGLFISDDIDTSRAWKENKDFFSRSFVVLDSKKFFGIATIF